MNRTIDIINERIQNFGTISVFILFILLECFAKSYTASGDYSLVPLVVKTIFFSLTGLLLILQKGIRKELLYLSILILIYVLSQLSINDSFSPNSFVIAGKFIAPLILLMLFNSIPKTERSEKIKFNLFEWIMTMNSVLILIGLLSSTYLFKSYLGNRFGYNGIFVTPSVSSYAYIITLFYFIISYKENVFRKWRFIVIYISCFFLGTKAMYLGLISLTAYIIYLQKFRYKNTILSLTAILSAVGGYLFFYKYGLFSQIRKLEGLISALLSYRDRLFIENTMPYINENWGILNYFIGGVNNFNLRSQMELFDVFFFWGLIGGLFYYWTFVKSYVTFEMTKTLWVFTALFLVIVFFSGNFFVYSINIVFLLVLRDRIDMKNWRNKKVF